MQSEKPTILILVGITGDLSRKKLLPAIKSLEEQGGLPKRFKLVGISRKDGQGVFTMDLDNESEYARLKKYIEETEQEWGIKAQKIFYLSVPPQVSLPIIEHLGKSGIASMQNAKLMIEKPFGLDLAHAKAFAETTRLHFFEEQIYRVDHYLAKESVQKLKEREFDFSAINQIEISASETSDVAGREAFYEQTGALRDFVQSHLLEVAAMCANPENRLLALSQFYIPEDKPIPTYVKRGQYKGYREQVHNPNSNVETKVSVTLQSHDARLKDVLFTLKTGKALDRKSTDIFVFKADGTREAISLNDTENAYEKVFLDAIAGKTGIFVSTNEMLETWRIISPIQEAWKTSSDDLLAYEVGSEM